LGHARVARVAGAIRRLREAKPKTPPKTLAASLTRHVRIV